MVQEYHDLHKKSRGSIHSINRNQHKHTGGIIIAYQDLVNTKEEILWYSNIQ